MKNSWGGIYFGIVLVVLGLGFLAQNFGLVNVGEFLGTWWPTYIFIAFGLMQMINHKSRGGLFFGGFIVALGVAFQLDELNIIAGRAGGLVWPLIIITIGLSILYRTANPPKPFKGMSSGSDAFFGENDHDFSDKEFEGIDTSTMLGSTKIDLREAKITNDKVTLNTSTILGETVVYVPKDFVITKHMDVILAEIKDHTNNTTQSGKTIEFTGTIVLGSLEIRN